MKASIKLSISCLILMLGFSLFAQAQKISGVLKDSATGETLRKFDT